MNFIEQNKSIQYAEIIPQPFPAREAIFVRGLPKGARVEISVIAHSPAQNSCC